MVESVVTAALKAAVCNGRAGSSPARGTNCRKKLC